MESKGAASLTIELDATKQGCPSGPPFNSTRDGRGSGSRKDGLMDNSFMWLVAHG